MAETTREEIFANLMAWIHEALHHVRDDLAESQANLDHAIGGLDAAEKHITILRAQRDEWPQRVAALPWGRWAMDLGAGNLDDIKNEVLNLCAADLQTACKSADNGCRCPGCEATQQSPCTTCGHPAKDHYLGDEGRTVFCRECGCTHDTRPSEAAHG